MICPHCQEEVEQIQIYQKIEQRQTLSLINQIPFLERDITLLFPDGKPALTFRCGHCSGLLPERAGHNLLRQAQKS